MVLYGIIRAYTPGMDADVQTSADVCNCRRLHAKRRLRVQTSAGVYSYQLLHAGFARG